MKKILFSTLIVLLSLVSSFAQSNVTIMFQCQTTDGTYQHPDSVTVENITRHWTETLYYPDTVYTLLVGTDVTVHLREIGMQVMPNPFDGTTRVNIQSEKSEQLVMRIVDMNGRLCAEYSGALQEGGNLFTVSLAVPHIYVLTVRTSTGTRSLKMENVGRAGADRIAYEGCMSSLLPIMQLKSSSSHEFQLGDEMRYQAFASSRVSYATDRKQTADEQIPLLFDMHGVACNGAPTVRDYDGNVYNTVQIGSQCWMKENLRTTHYANGEYIALSAETPSFDVAYRYIPLGQHMIGAEYVADSNVSTYGFLYNWKAVMHNSTPSETNPSGVQGICPSGWHVPSSSELSLLLENAYSYVEDLPSAYFYTAYPLAATFGWDTNFIDDTYDRKCYKDCNLSGFSLLPAGAFYNPAYGSDAVYHYVYDMHWNAFLWSSTEAGTHKSPYLSLTLYPFDNFDQPCYAHIEDIQKSYGFSVRCLKD